MIDYSKISRGTSFGNQDKYILDNGWFKVDTSIHEGIVEEIASKILTCSTVKSSYVKYKRFTHNNKEGCYSENFLASGEEIVTFYRLLTKVQPIDDINSLFSQITVDERIDYTIQVIENLTGVNVQQYLRDSLTLDCIIRNGDRHLNNLAVIHNTIDNTWRECPIFDNGDALQDINCIAQPFSTSFQNQMKVLGIGFKVNLKQLNKYLLDYKVNKNILVLRQLINMYPNIFIKETF